jgi:ubiquinone/menaquinone biosynthesis C-methylase UbiE
MAGTVDSRYVDRGTVSPAESWDAFFSEFYLRAYAHDEADDRAEGQALAAARLAGTSEGGEVLDAPCGFGRHSIPLARAGYRVTGVDRAAPLIEEARRRSEGERWPKWSVSDYRELPLPDASFDLVVNLFSSLGYLGDEQDTRALAEFRRVLRPEGRLVLETMHRDALVTNWHEQDWRLLGEGRLLLEQRTFDPAAGIAQMTQTLVPSSGTRESRTMSLRVYTATELLAMLDRAGFSEARCHGDLEGAPFGTGTRLVIVARP